MDHIFILMDLHDILSRVIAGHENAIIVSGAKLKREHSVQIGHSFTRMRIMAEMEGRDLASAARRIISQQPHFRGREMSFDFQCEDNVLVVRGKVPTFFLKQILQRALSDLKGIQRIDNQVQVMYCHELGCEVSDFNRLDERYKDPVSC